MPSTPRSGSRAGRDRIRVFGIDDHPEVLQALERLISEQDDLTWAGRASSAAQAQALLAQDPPDVVLLDARLHGESGVDLCERIHRSQEEVGILLLTASIDERQLLRALTLGASGFLIKNARGREILDAIRTVHQGGVVFDRSLGQAVLREMRKIGRVAEETGRLEASRERLRQLYQGMTSVAGIRSVDAMLQRIVAVNKEVTEARYAALAVLKEDESIAQFITVGMDPDEMREIGSLPHGRGLLGEVIHTKRPLRVDAIPAHPRSHGMPQGHPPMQTFLGVPMLFQGEVVGHLYVTDKRGGEPFTHEDEELMGLLANLAAVLIKNLRQSRDLERLAVLEERQRIGMNLHDGTLQTIYGVLLGLDAVLEALPQSAKGAYETINGLADRLRDITDEIRRHIYQLKAETLPLLPAIEGIIENLGLTDVVHIHSSDMSYTLLPPGTVEQLVHFTQEALNNVVRHAQASRVDITWRRVGEEFHLVIEDDGVGFDPALPPPPGHFGRRNLEERARLAGGRLAIHSSPSEGSRIQMTARMPEIAPT